MVCLKSASARRSKDRLRCGGIYPPAFTPFSEVSFLEGRGYSLVACGVALLADACGEHSPASSLPSGIEEYEETRRGVSVPVVWMYPRRSSR